MIKTETGFSTLVKPDAAISVDSSRYEEQFGGEPVTLLLKGSYDAVFSPANLAVLSDFHDWVAADERYRTVTSPLTVIQEAMEEAAQSRLLFEQQLAEAQQQAAEEAVAAAAAMGLGEAEQQAAAEQARAEVLQMFHEELDQLAQMGEPSLDNPVFIASVIYDDEGNVRPALQQLLPSEGHALISVVPVGNMNDAGLLKAATDAEDYFVSHPLDGVEITMFAFAKLIDAISQGISGNIFLLLGISVAVMILIMLFIFRVRHRMLSLIMVGISAMWTFGLMGYLQVPMTMATMAVLPILLGLGIDFSIQFHNRYQEELSNNRNIGHAIVASISNMLTPVSIALLATIIGFVTLYSSRVPMIQDFGLVLAIGIFISYLVSIFVLHSIIRLGDRNKPIAKLRESAVKAGSRIERFLLRLGKLAVNHTAWILVISVLFGVGGGIVDSWLPVNTDYEELMPQDTPALVELRDLRAITGNEGVLHLMVETGGDLFSADALVWLKDYQDDMTAAHPQLISARSIATLVSDAAGGSIPSQTHVDAIVAGLSPSYLSQLVSADRTTASLTFTTPYLSMADTHDLLEVLQVEAESPFWMNITPVGSLALGTSVIDALIGDRMKLNIICLSAIFLVLLLSYRRIGSTVFTIIPVGAVIAWSSLDMYLIGIPLNPLTAVLGVLVIGICTEFMVLLTGRYEEEKKLGLSPKEAMITAIGKIGRAIVTTALTTMGGFAVLIVSNFVMIRDFGIATVISVLLSLVITITVMPGLIVWYDNLRRRWAARKAK